MSKVIYLKQFFIILCLGVQMSLTEINAQVFRDRPDIQIKTEFDCHHDAKNPCNIESFKLHHYNYRILFAGDPRPSYGTAAYMSYETRDVDQLEDYAFVQFIKGCAFESRVDEETGEIRKRFHLLRHFFDELVDFHHPEWVIDSIDKDPMYNNMEPHNRHGAYRWNRVRGSYDRKTEVFYQNRKPRFPLLYASDHPSTSFLTAQGARNMSLKFKTCIYQTNDIPLVSSPKDMDPSQALGCFNWQSSFIYNHKTGEYESPEEIDEFCLRK